LASLPRSVRPSRAAPINDDCPSRLPPSRPQQVLELASQLVPASRGCIAFFASDGQTIDHLTCLGVPQESIHELARSSWIRQLLRLVLEQEAPLCLADLRDQMRDLGGVTAFGPIGAVLGLPLTALGRSRGALLLLRHPDEGPFREGDQETLLPLCRWVEQESVLEEAQLLAQLRLL